MNISFKKNINHSYMVIEKVSDFSPHHFVMKMMSANEIPGLLKIGYENINGQYNMLYDISSRQAFSKLFETRKLSFENLRAFLFSLKGVLRSLREYLLDPDNIMLKQECIFADVEGNRFEYCYYPYYNGDLVLELKELFTKLLTMVDYEDDKAVRLVYEMHTEMQKEHFTIDHLMAVYERTADEPIPKVQKVIPEEGGLENALPKKTGTGKVRKPGGFFTEDRSVKRFPAEEDAYEEETGFFDKIRFYLKGKNFMEILEDINNREIIEKIKQCGKIPEAETAYRPGDVLPLEKKPDFEYISLSAFDFKDRFAEESSYGGTVLLGTAETEARKLVGMDTQRSRRFVVDRFPFTIGNEKAGSDAFLDEAAVSRIHARIYKTGGGGYAIILTGGIANSEKFTKMVSDRVQFIAPVVIYAGENEMDSLAFGALRVLRGEEEAKEFNKVEGKI